MASRWPSQRYFGHDVSQLTLPEAALLAGIIQAPSRFDPYKNPKTTTNRRDTVLDKMHQLGYITDAEWVTAKATPLNAQVIPEAQAEAQSHYPAPHFVEEVKRYIRSNPVFGKTAAERNDLLTNGGLRIYTTLDLHMQALRWSRRSSRSIRTRAAPTPTSAWSRSSRRPAT